MSDLRENFHKLIEFARDNNFLESFSNIYFVEDKSILHILSARTYAKFHENQFLVLKVMLIVLMSFSIKDILG